MTASGFENAPVTRAIIILVTVLTVTIGSTDSASLDLNAIANGEVWRLFTSHFAFQNMAQAFIGLITLYCSRHFERQLGIKKFTAFVVLSYIMSLLLQISLVLISKALGIESFIPAQGPYFVIFALLSLFYSHIPKLQSRALALGLDFSEKSWVYLLAFQLLLANGVSSALSSAIGTLIGYLYDKNIFRLQRFRLPSAVERSMTAANAYLATFFNRPDQRTVYQRQPDIDANFTHDQVYGDWNNMHGDMDERMMQYGGFSSGPAVRMPQASEESIQMLMGLGFDRPTVLEALASTGNNVDAAANQLLTYNDLTR